MEVLTAFIIIEVFAWHIRKISTKTCIFLFYFTGQLESTDLFNLELLPSSQDHYRQLLPRFGHSLSTDSQGTLWVFGGYSFTQGGPLNDIRAFDTKNVSWLPITVHFTVSNNLFFLWNHFHENFREIWFHGKIVIYGIYCINVYLFYDDTKYFFSNFRAMWISMPKSLKKDISILGS